jgi:hypothetical protein
MAVDRFSLIKSCRFGQLTYGNSPDVKLNYTKKSRAADVENYVTSLAEFEGEASASAQTYAYEGLVCEGSKLLEDKRLSTSRKRQQTASGQEAMATRPRGRLKLQPAKLRLGATSWNA